MRDLTPVREEMIFGSEKDGVRTNVTLNNSYLDSPIFDNRRKANRGFFSLSYIFDASSHADARLTFEFWVSPTGQANDWMRSSIHTFGTTDGYSIIADVHEGSGTDSDGKDTITFRPAISRFMKIRVTETASQNAVFSTWKTVQ